SSGADAAGDGGHRPIRRKGRVQLRSKRFSGWLCETLVSPRRCEREDRCGGEPSFHHCLLRGCRLAKLPAVHVRNNPAFVAGRGTRVGTPMTSAGWCSCECSQILSSEQAPVRVLPC